jgi:uncharacterized membrane protein
MKQLTKYFLNGLAFLVPVVVTIYVIYVVFVKIDGLFKFPIPGMGVLATLVVITVIGFLASNFLTRWVVRIVDGILGRLPLVKMIYSSIKDLIHAFVGEKKGFNRPVTVSLGGGVKAFGFVTCDSLEKLGLKDTVSVYLPQSYNFAGNLIMVPSEQVTPLDTDSGDLMAFIVSGGIASK